MSQKFEYLVVDVDGDTVLQEFLNEMGNAGWALSSIRPVVIEYGIVVMIFMREKQ